MTNYLWIALGGAVGSVGRCWLTEVLDRQTSAVFPFGTLTAADGRWPASPAFRHFFMAGICGGFTTFSAFSLQTLNLARDGRMMLAGANVLGSVALCLAAAWLGHLAALGLKATRGN